MKILLRHLKKGTRIWDINAKTITGHTALMLAESGELQDGVDQTIVDMLKQHGAKTLDHLLANWAVALDGNAVGFEPGESWRHLHRRLDLHQTGPSLPSCLYRMLGTII